MSEIKFLTLNLLLGGVFFDKVLKFLNQEKPDIMVFQEVYNGQDEKLDVNFQTVKILKENFRNYDCRFATEHKDKLDLGKLEYGNVVFSRFPIKTNHVYFYDLPYDALFVKEKLRGDFSLEPHNLQHVVLDINGVMFNIFNTHGIWGLDGDDNPRRLEMSKIIVKHIKDKKNVILAGDFNVQPNTKTVNNIEKYLVNVFKGQLKTTFNMKRKDNLSYAKAVVDMVFVSQNIKILKRKCPQVDISDHLPLVCTFTV